MRTEGSMRVAVARRLADAFNRRSLDEALDLLAGDVDWPNVREGRRLRGRDAVREYWLNQWQLTNSHIEPLEFREFADRLVIRVHQYVTDKQGSVIADQVIGHVLTFDDAAIARLDVYPSTEAALAAVAEGGEALADRPG